MKTFLCALLVLGTLASVRASEPIDSMDLDTLRARAGTEAVVVGPVTDVGTTSNGGITFINIGMPKKKGFVAVVFRKNYPNFPEGFDKYRSQKVKVSGLLELYRTEQPQIVVTSPEQIQIVTE